MHAAGVPVELTVTGSADCVAAGVELSAYRVVQEALTNVIKHAGTTSAVDVNVRYLPGSLEVEVVDDGRGAAGIDERRRRHRGTDSSACASASRCWGGDLAVGPVAGGGYRVRRHPPVRGRRVTVRVVVADDQVLVRSGFTVLLAGEPDIEVVGEAGNGAEAVALVASERPDVVLMDVRMPVMDGLEATRKISEDASLSDTKVVILTTFDLDEYVHEALRAGASGFLLKDTLPVDLINAVRVVAGGDALISPKITRRLIEEFARRPEPGGAADADGRLGQLTEREREVLETVARGQSNAEIAEALFVSHATVKTHVSRLLMKLGARDRAQLVMIAYETGMVAPGGVLMPASSAGRARARQGPGGGHG